MLTTNTIQERKQLQVAIIGGGSWGTAISRIVAKNAEKYSIFSSSVYMWIRNELYKDEELKEYMNREHENPKYLPGIKLPTNLIVISDFSLLHMADLIIFAVPHQFLENVLTQLKGRLSPKAHGISLVKGLGIRDGSPFLFSNVIHEELGIPCSILSGANVALNIARNEFSETTIGYPVDNVEIASVWQRLFDDATFKVNCLPDIKGIEICGALKNVIALGAGFCDGMKLGSNTKAAIIRIGFEEMRFFASYFFSPIFYETFFDSAGYPDVITTCFGGRNVKCAEAFIQSENCKDWSVLEASMLNGQKLQGPLTCSDVYKVICHHHLEKKMPFFVTVYEISFNRLNPQELIGRFTTETLRSIHYVGDCTPLRQTLR